MRLNKFIATNTGYSRRKADELIENGAVGVNGKITTTLGTTIDPEKDKIIVNKKPVTPQNTKVYLALNKPPGYITTRADEQNRPTVMDLVPPIPNLKPVGRLDKDSQGLLLLSNDGEFINRHTHPKFNCIKVYLTKVLGEINEEKLKKLQAGIRIDNYKTHPAKIQILRNNSTQALLRVEIQEGRNRQIRKMFAAIGHHVKYLQRIAIGTVKLGNLKEGSFRNLTMKEIHAK